MRAIPIPELEVERGRLYFMDEVFLLCSIVILTI